MELRGEYEERDAGEESSAVPVPYGRMLHSGAVRQA